MQMQGQWMTRVLMQTGQAYQRSCPLSVLRGSTSMVLFVGQGDFICCPSAGALIPRVL